MDLEKNICPVVKVDGFISSGKQYDVDITLPEDNRSVIYGVIKDIYDRPVKNAVVKLIEIDKDCGKVERKPVTHTFTDKNGEFVFGPLCANKFYEVQIWADKVRHHKLCTTCHHEGNCLKGTKVNCELKDFLENRDSNCNSEKDCSDYEKE